MEFTDLDIGSLKKKVILVILLLALETYSLDPTADDKHAQCNESKYFCDSNRVCLPQEDYCQSQACNITFDECCLSSSTEYEICADLSSSTSNRDTLVIVILCSCLGLITFIALAGGMILYGQRNRRKNKPGPAGNQHQGYPVSTTQGGTSQRTVSQVAVYKKPAPGFAAKEPPGPQLPRMSGSNISLSRAEEGSLHDLQKKKLLRTPSNGSIKISDALTPNIKNEIELRRRRLQPLNSAAGMDFWRNKISQLVPALDDDDDGGSHDGKETKKPSVVAMDRRDSKQSRRRSSESRVASTVTDRISNRDSEEFEFTSSSSSLDTEYYMRSKRKHQKKKLKKKLMKAALLRQSYASARSPISARSPDLVYGAPPPNQMYGPVPDQMYGSMHDQNMYGSMHDQNMYGTMPEQNMYGNMPEQNMYGSMPPGGAPVMFRRQ